MLLIAVDIKKDIFQFSCAMFDEVSAPMKWKERQKFCGNLIRAIISIDWTIRRHLHSTDQVENHLNPSWIIVRFVKTIFCALVCIFVFDCSIPSAQNHSPKWKWGCWFIENGCWMLDVIHESYHTVEARMLSATCLMFTQLKAPVGRSISNWV